MACALEQPEALRRASEGFDLEEDRLSPRLEAMGLASGWSGIGADL